MQDLNKKTELLLKPYWYAKDIMEFYDVSLSTATNIKAKVQQDCGCVLYYKDYSTQPVKTDDVISYMGGKDRLYELQILNEYKKEMYKNA